MIDTGYWYVYSGLSKNLCKLSQENDESPLRGSIAASLRKVREGPAVDAGKRASSLGFETLFWGSGVLIVYRKSEVSPCIYIIIS